MNTSTTIHSYVDNRPVILQEHNSGNIDVWHKAKLLGVVWVNSHDEWEVEGPSASWACETKDDAISVLLDNYG